MKTILTFIIVFGILVIVHEFGHFFFAKRSGILVREFEKATTLLFCDKCSSICFYLFSFGIHYFTDIAGTTRDVIEEYVNVRGVPLKLIDTAGIRETEDKVERIGVERSRKAIEQADLVMLVLNASEELTDEDKELIQATSGKKRIVILNKTDLPQKLNMDEVRELVPEDELITTSVLKKTGVDKLEEKIAELFFGGIENSQSTIMVTNARHIALLNQAEDSLDAY